jgi:hypothetical protein
LQKKKFKEVILGRNIISKINNLKKGVLMKFTKHFLLSALLATSLSLASVKSEAGLIVTVFNPAIGLIIGGVSTYGVFTVYEPNGVLAISILGLILDKNTNEVEFTAISDVQAKTAGLTLTEKESYNGDLDRINASFEEMNSAISNASKEQSEAVKNDALEKFKSDISADTFSAVQKILKTSNK